MAHSDVLFLAPIENTTFHHQLQWLTCLPDSFGTFLTCLCNAELSNLFGRLSECMARSAHRPFVCPNLRSKFDRLCFSVSQFPLRESRRHTAVASKNFFDFLDVFFIASAFWRRCSVIICKVLTTVTESASRRDN